MKKGFTVVELIVSFSLTAVIATFLIQLVLSLNNIYKTSGVKTEIMNKQSLISNHINKTLSEKSISSLTSCGNYCLKFNYNDYTSDTFTIDYANNILTFGSYSTNLPENTSFKNVNVDIVYGATIDSNSNNAILNIVIPIYNDEFKNDNFSVNVAYQFNTDNTNIGYVNFAGSGKYIVLNGDTEQSFNTQTAYVEQGYNVYDKDGNIITGNVEIDNPLTTTPYKAGKYRIKYSLKDESGNIISQATRSITVKPSTYEITNLVVNGSFEDGMNGWDRVMNSVSHEIITDSTKAKYGNSSANIYFDAGGWAMQTVSNLKTNNKYYVSSYINIVDLPSGNAGIRVDDKITDITSYNNTIAYVTNGYVKIGGIFIASADELEFWYGGDYGGPTAYYDGYLLVDLTESFGTGNEPSKEWCDENINWFEGTTKISY